MENVTIVVLYTGEDSEHYVGALPNMPTREEQEELARRMNAKIDGDEGAHADVEGSVISFRTVPLTKLTMTSIWDAS